MTYENIWQKIRRMSQHNRKHLAYEMTLVGLNVGYIHPHYYFDAKAVHDILFYPSDSQHEIEDKDGTYYNALKRIIENDKEIHVRVKRYVWLPRFINDWREGKIVKDYICSRINEEYVNAWYKILPGRSLAGERSRSLFITLTGGMEITYKMTECSHKNGYELLTFSRTDIS
jgi:hypothetical protein